MHLMPGVAIQPNLELKARPKQILGSLPLVITLPVPSDSTTSNDLETTKKKNPPPAEFRQIWRQKLSKKSKIWSIKKLSNIFLLLLLVWTAVFLLKGRAIRLGPEPYPGGWSHSVFWPRGLYGSWWHWCADCWLSMRDFVAAALASPNQFFIYYNFISFFFIYYINV